MVVLDNESLRSRLMEQFHIDDYFESMTRLRFELVNFAKDEIILKEGENSDYIYFILVGRVKLYSCNVKRDFGITYMSKGLVGDVQFVAETVSPYCVRAVNETLCMQLNVKGCRHRLMSDRSFLRYLTSQLAEKVAFATSSENESSVEMTSEDRLYEYLKVSSEGELVTMSLREISPVMGVSYRHLIRMMNSLCDDGRLRHGGKKGEYYLN